jgi:ABC-type nickel/cobalt efflux system permease component RcnA
MTSFADLIQQGSAHAWLFIPSAILLGASGFALVICFSIGLAITLVSSLSLSHPNWG